MFLDPFFLPCFGDFRIRVRAIVLNAWRFESDFLFFSFFLPCFGDLRARVSVTVCNDWRLGGDFLLFYMNITVCSFDFHEKKNKLYMKSR